MRKIAVAITKGGTGKTTTAVNLAHGLSLRGKRVLLIDLDTQGQCAEALGVEPTYNVADLVDKRVKPSEVLVEARPNLWLAAGGRRLAGLKRDISRRDMAPERVLEEAFRPLLPRYDYAIVDTAPSWSELNINAFFLADEVLSPVLMEILTIRGLVEFNRNIKDIRQYRPELHLRYILPTLYDRRVRQTAEILAQLQSTLGELLLDPIRINVRLSEAPGHGQTIFEYDPTSPGAEDYTKLVERIVQDE